MLPKKYHRRISGVYNYLKSQYLFGFKYQCIFCKGHFRKFLPTGLRNDITLTPIEGISLYLMPSMSFIRSRKIGLLVYS
jgi:hypothetical protein